ncbi:hypothetical protein [Kingella oralis]|uniref:hypothetical protein n=1 Tax=Kingella oralis TaxID=505 RepID=UPI0034E44C0F
MDEKRGGEVGNGASAARAACSIRYLDNAPLPRHWVARCAKVSGCRKHPAQGSLKQYNPALASHFQAA